MAEPWFVLNEDDYPCPVLPPAKAVGSVREAYIAQELQGPEKRTPGEDKSVEEQEGGGSGGPVCTSPKSRILCPSSWCFYPWCFHWSSIWVSPIRWLRPATVGSLWEF
ncbi:hypothetical protein MTO96_023301 [Rhipicephalus appendiculatus]